MQIELIPIALGVLLLLIGLAVLVDGWSNPESGPMRDRRRRIRESIDQPGEQMVGGGTILLGATLIGRFAWRFGTLSVLAGTILILAGAFRNRRYLKEGLFFRGAARRGAKEESDRPSDPPSKLRIR